MLALVVFASIPALFGPVMEPDSALYASIAKNMVQRGEWMDLYVRGVDWLDKPHLTFWIAAVFFKLFGISAFAYKLPNFLFGLLGAWYLFKFAKSLYSEKVAWLSALIFLSSIHIIISMVDVRAEIYITTFTFASLYHYYKGQNGRFWHLVAGSFMAACAIMIKGIFVLITILGGMILYWLLTKQLKQLLKIKWWLALILIGVFITPELYSLYTQFDLHPEKVMFGKSNVSGLKFFVWDSQFGRFFNNGPIKGKGDPSFFLHTTLWAFLPWCFLFYTAVFKQFKTSDTKAKPEIIIIWASAGITFLLFSLSKFQLPHYILMILPQFAIITASYIDRLNAKEARTFAIIQKVVLVLVSLILIAIAYITDFPSRYIFMGIVIAIALRGLLFFKANSANDMVGISAITSISFAIFASIYFYPNILKYEAGKEAAIWLNKNKPELKSAVFNNGEAFSYDFYAKADPIYFWEKKSLSEYPTKKELAIYVQESRLPELKQDYRVQILKEFDYYHATKLSLKFLNAKTRSQTLEKYYLVKID